MGESTPLSGPDVGAAFRPTTCAQGAPLLGHAGGQAVMLVRAGQKVLAMAATCTHYGGPLAQGLVAGTSVRCPWHHACFDLETGLARGRGLTPFACYDVIAEGNLVRVGKKRADYEAPPVAGPSSIVIVGAGGAGAACAETLRRDA